MSSSLTNPTLLITRVRLVTHFVFKSGTCSLVPEYYLEIKTNRNVRTLKNKTKTLLTVLLFFLFFPKQSCFSHD